MGAVRIVLADDHPIVLVGLRELITRDRYFQIAGEATDATGLVRAVSDFVPDIIVSDYNMPGDTRYGDGLALLGYLRRTFPAVHILVHTMVTTPVILSSLYEIGVKGVVPKNADMSMVVTALRAISHGEIYRPTGLLDSTAFRQGPGAAARLKTLSPKEIEVLRCFASGASVSEIAAQMKRSIKTVSAQKVSVMRKLEITTDHELVMFCITHNVFV